jgi:hypothetical protein
MSAIESVLVENRVFPPSEAIVKASRISGMAAYEALCKEAEQDFEGFWSRLARENVQWTKPFHEDARRVERPLLQVVLRRRTQCQRQLPRPARRHAGGEQDRHHLRIR